MRGKSNRDAPFHGCQSSSCRRLLLSMLTYRAAARNTRIVSRVRRDTLCLQNHEDINARPVATKCRCVPRRPVDCPQPVVGRPVRAFLNSCRSDSYRINHPRPLFKIRAGSAIRSRLSPDAVALRGCFEWRSRGHPDARATTALSPQYPTAPLRATRRGRNCSSSEPANAHPATGLRMRVRTRSLAHAGSRTARLEPRSRPCLKATSIVRRYTGSCEMHSRGRQ